MSWKASSGILFFCLRSRRLLSLVAGFPVSGLSVSTAEVIALGCDLSLPVVAIRFPLYIPANCYAYKTWPYFNSFTVQH